MDECIPIYIYASMNQWLNECRGVSEWVNGGKMSMCAIEWDPAKKTLLKSLKTVKTY